jgi:hypothetical protein
MRTYVNKENTKKGSYNVLHEDFIALSRCGLGEPNGERGGGDSAEVGGNRFGLGGHS